jgi:hypothetical protein
MLGGEPVRRARRPRASQHDRDLNERLRQVCQQILDRLAWAENTTINPADWPDLTPAALDRLRAHAAEQRRLAALDRAAVSSLLTDLRAPSSTAAGPNVAPPPTTVAGPRPRTVWPPDQDRRSAEQDRDDSTRDRGQAATEREQADSRDIVAAERAATRVDDSLIDRTALSVAKSRQRIANSRAYLAHDQNHSETATITNDPNSNAPNG